jgi:hypothetical protein
MMSSFRRGRMPGAPWLFEHTLRDRAGRARVMRATAVRHPGRLDSARRRGATLRDERAISCGIRSTGRSPACGLRDRPFMEVR